MERVFPSCRSEAPFRKFYSVGVNIRKEEKYKIMKRAGIGVALVLLVLSVASLIPGRAQEANAPPKAGGPPPANPLKVALLKWYPANQTTSFKVGKSPLEVAFDGANIWVVNSGDSTLHKLRASDGATLGKFNVGASYGVAFDGANIWATRYDDRVAKVRASDGALLGTYGVGKSPFWLAFDGANIWVANEGENTVSKLRASDGANLGTFTVNTAPLGVACDGENIWVTTLGGNSVTKLRATDGTVLGTFAVGSQPYGVAFDGASIWVANRGDGTVTKLRSSDGAKLGTFYVGFAYGIAFDGANIWVTGGEEVEILRPSDGTILVQIHESGEPTGLAFDGANMWVAMYDSGAVLKM